MAMMEKVEPREVFMGRLSHGVTCWGKSLIFAEREIFSLGGSDRCVQFMNSKIQYILSNLLS
jgi:hypothetical protein